MRVWRHFQIFAGTVYGALKCGEDEKWIWINIALGLPVTIMGFVFLAKSDMPDFVYISRESEFTLSMAYIFITAFQNAAGIRLGRIITGKCRGTRQFYLSDVCYITVSAFCCIVLCAALKKSRIIIDINGNSFYERAIFYVIAMFFAMSLLYGLFSRFERLSERLARAMTAGYLIFSVFNIVYISEEYKRFIACHGETLAKSHKIQILLGNSGFWPAVFAGIAAFGVFAGYYWRLILADREVKKADIKKPVIVFSVAAILIVTAAKLLDNQYLFYRQQSLWSVVDVNKDDIRKLEYKTLDESFETENSESINGFVSELVMQRGCVLKTFPQTGHNRGLGNGYTVKAFDKSGKLLFELVTIYRGEIDVRTGCGGEYKNYNFLIPAQFYGKEDPRDDVYKSIVTGQ